MEKGDCALFVFLLFVFLFWERLCAEGEGGREVMGRRSERRNEKNVGGCARTHRQRPP